MSRKPKTTYNLEYKDCFSFATSQILTLTNSIEICTNIYNIKLISLNCRIYFSLQHIYLNLLIISSKNLIKEKFTLERTKAQKTLMYVINVIRCISMQFACISAKKSS